MGHKKVFSTPWFYVEALPSPDSDLLNHPFYRIVEAEGVFALVLTEMDELVMVRQYRPAIGQKTLEFPAGAVDVGETPLDAIRRELCEETGFQCSTILLMGGGVLKPNRNKCWEWYCLGVGAKRVPNWQESGENIETVLLSRPMFRDMIVDGRFVQLAALSLLTVASIRYNIDILGDSLDLIQKKVDKLASETPHQEWSNVTCDC